MQKVQENRCQSCKKSDNIWEKYPPWEISPIWWKRGKFKDKFLRFLDDYYAQFEARTEKAKAAQEVQVTAITLNLKF